MTPHRIHVIRFAVPRLARREHRRLRHPAEEATAGAVCAGGARQRRPGLADGVVATAGAAPARRRAGRFAAHRGAAAARRTAGLQGRDLGPAGTDLLQDTLLRAFEDSGRIPGVARRGSGIAGDYELLLDLRRFESDYAGGGSPAAVIEVGAKLVATRSNSVVASRTFRQAGPSASTDIGAGRARVRPVRWARSPARSSAGPWSKGNATPRSIRHRRANPLARPSASTSSSARSGETSG